jgi:hypothetical protein
MKDHRQRDSQRAQQKQRSQETHTGIVLMAGKEVSTQRKGARPHRALPGGWGGATGGRARPQGSSHFVSRSKTRCSYRAGPGTGDRRAAIFSLRSRRAGRGQGEARERRWCFGEGKSPGVLTPHPGPPHEPPPWNWQGRIPLRPHLRPAVGDAVECVPAMAGGEVHGEGEATARCRVSHGLLSKNEEPCMPVWCLVRDIQTERCRFEAKPAGDASLR